MPLSQHSLHYFCATSSPLLPLVLSPLTPNPPTHHNMVPSRFTTPQDSFYDRVYARARTHASSRTRIEDSQTPRDKLVATRCKSLDPQSHECRTDILRRSELNATNSPLLRLPAELRNTIYTYVFSYTACVFKDFNNDIIFDPNQPYSFQECNLALPATSRQLYAKTALLPYKLGRFDFYFRRPESPWEVHMRAFIGRRSKEQLRAMGEMDGVGFGLETRDNRPYCGIRVQWADASAGNDVKASIPEYIRRRLKEI